MQERAYADTFDPTTATLAVSGTVAEGAIGRFEKSLSRHSEDLTRRLVVDLSDVDFFPSAAVSVLAAALRESRRAPERIELISSDGTVAQRVLQICGIPHTAT